MNSTAKYQKYRLRLIAKQLRYYYRHKAKVSQTVREWQKKNPDKQRAYLEKYKKLKPWLVSLSKAKERCKREKTAYQRKGIKCELDKTTIKQLWDSYQAARMKRPNLHRFDSDKNYTLENCAFVPQELHSKLEGLPIEEQKQKIWSYLNNPELKALNRGIAAKKGVRLHLKKGPSGFYALKG